MGIVSERDYIRKAMARRIVPEMGEEPYLREVSADGSFAFELISTPAIPLQGGAGVAGGSASAPYVAYEKP